MSNSKLDHLTALLEEDRAAVWAIEEAIELCRLIEAIAPTYGCHVALTGGCLYKDGRRKDADILFYRIRQVTVIDKEGLLSGLTKIGLEIKKKHGWVVKAEWDRMPVDLFFPEEITQTLEGKCLDNQYPEGPICSACNGPRSLSDGQWIHSASPALKWSACYMEYSTDKIYLLVRSANTGNPICPHCKKELLYILNRNLWSHVNVEANPNFIGSDILKYSGATLFGTSFPNPPPTNLPPILPIGIDISVDKSVESELSKSLSKSIKVTL